MGRPKQLLPFRGRTLVECSLAALEPHTEEQLLLGDGPVPAQYTGMQRLRDYAGVAGPLAGIEPYRLEGISTSGPMPHRRLNALSRAAVRLPKRMASSGV